MSRLYLCWLRGRHAWTTWHGVNPDGSLARCYRVCGRCPERVDVCL